MGKWRAQCLAITQGQLLLLKSKKDVKTDTTEDAVNEEELYALAN